MLQSIKTAINNLHARLVRKYRTREIIKVLQLSHAAELAHTPGEQWPLIKQRQAQEILAVRNGNIDIVDRRSWQFPYLPETLHRIRQPIIKNLPYNVRRFARTPIPRRAINLIKNSIIALKWGIQPINGSIDTADEETKERIEIAKKAFAHPNNQDSFQSFLEAAIDDFCINGAMCIEPQLTPDPARPFKMWTVDSSTVRIYADWKESTTDLPHYAQVTGLKGERGIIVFFDDELVYIKDNPSTDSPFGLGKMEVAFMSINYFVGVQEMAGRGGMDQVHKTWLWWNEPQAPHNMDIIRRHIMNDLEGQSKLSLVAGMKAPTPIVVQPVTNEDLLLPWQEMLIRVIAAGFDMSAMALNLERDVNRSTGEVLDDRDFRSAVLPTAVKVKEGFTRYILHRLLGWTDLEFVWLDIDDPDVQTKMALNQQMFACNAKTPNEIRKSMGLPPLNNGFADLTQIELVLINTEAAAKLQQQAADKQFERQMTQQSMMYQPYGGEEGGDEGAVQSATATVSMPKVPSLQMPKLPTIKGPSLPHLPMAGSIYTAQQVAAMSVDQVKAAINRKQLPKNKKLLAQEMENQEPGILQQLSDELKQYFQETEDQAQQDEIKIKITTKDKKEQLQKFNKKKHKPSEIERAYDKFASPNTDDAFKDKRSGTGTEIPRGNKFNKKPGRYSQ